MELGKVLLILLTVIFVVVAIICHLVAFSTDYWLKSSNSGQRDFLNIGLWTACFNGYIHPHETPQRTYDGCNYISSDSYKTIRDWLMPSWLVACQVLAVIGLILQALGLLLVLFLLIWIICRFICCQRKDDCCERFLIYCTPILFILAGMFLMMTAMVFADNAFKLQCKDFWVGGDPNNNHLSYSWGFEIAACVLSFVSGGLLIWLAVLKGREYPNYKGVNDVNT